MGLHPVKIKLLKHLGCLCAPLSFHQESPVSISALSQSSADLGRVYGRLSVFCLKILSPRERQRREMKKRKKERGKKKYKTENKIALLSQIKADLLTACVWFYSRSFCTRARSHALAMLGCCNPEKTPSNKFSVRQMFLESHRSRSLPELMSHSGVMIHS